MCFLQHGGKHSAPARGHRPEEALPGIPLFRRGPQHRRPGLEGTRRGGSLRAGAQRRGRHDGHFHQELRCCRGLHRREKGEREDGLSVGLSIQAQQLSDEELRSNIPELHHQVTQLWRSGSLSAPDLQPGHVNTPAHIPGMFTWSSQRKEAEICDHDMTLGEF